LQLEEFNALELEFLYLIKFSLFVDVERDFNRYLKEFRIKYERSRNDLSTCPLGGGVVQ